MPLFVLEELVDVVDGLVLRLRQEDPQKDSEPGDGDDEDEKRVGFEGTLFTSTQVIGAYVTIVFPVVAIIEWFQ